MKWLKAGDFSHNLNPKNFYDNEFEVCYTNPNPSAGIPYTINKITIYKLKNFDSIQMLIYSPNEEILSPLLRQAHLNFGSCVGRQSGVKPLSHKSQIDDLFSILGGFCDQFDKEFQREIFQELKLQKTDFDITTEILEMANLNLKDAILEAIKAQHDGYFEAIWVLAETLYKKMMGEEKSDNEIDPQILYDLYKAINSNNPHFKQANDKLLGLVRTQNPAPDEKETYLEEGFRYAFHGSDQDNKDILFNELYQKGPIEIREIGTADSYIALAKKIKNMQLQLDELTQYKAKNEARKQAKKSQATLFHVNNDRSGESNQEIEKKPRSKI